MMAGHALRLLFLCSLLILTEPFEVREDEWEELGPDIAALHHLTGLSQHMSHRRLQGPTEQRDTSTHGVRVQRLSSRVDIDQNPMSLQDELQDCENFTAGVIQMEQCFIREFRGQTAQRNVQPEPQDFKEPPVWQTSSRSQQASASASIGPVLSPSLGIHQMQMGALTLEVSSGDITKESSDVIVNSSNPDFTLKSGVSKAILDGAGSAVEEECSQIVNSPGYQSNPMIMTSAGKLPSKNILHVVGQNDPAKINEMVLMVLNVCEDNKCSSVSLPALGTGQGGASPSAVADAMVGAVVEFVKKKQPRFVRSVKILIFQTAMTKEFHRSMKRWQGQEVEEKSVFTKFKESVTSFFMGPGEERPDSGTSVLEEEEFESIVFQLCADTNKAVSQAKRKILDLIVAEQAKRTITDQYISELSQDDVDQLQALQRELTISLRLDKGDQPDQGRLHRRGCSQNSSFGWI